MRVKNQPANLYISLDRRTGRFRCQYKHPVTGKFHGLGSDPAQAAKDAQYLNAQLGNARLDRIVATAGMPLARWLREYRTIQDRRLRDGEIAAATHRQRLWMVARLEAAMGAQALPAITVRDCAQLLAGFGDKRRQAQAMRSLMVDVWREAMQAGEVDDCAPAKTKAPRVKVQRQRLTLDAWRAIYEAAGSLDPWVRHSMLLALLTGQRREDLAALQYKQARDGYLWLEQEKTGFRLAIPLGLELLDMGTVGEAIRSTKGRVLSRWVLHHTKPRAFAERGAAVHVDTISRNFARARRLAGLDAQNAPTFHEQRSLALRLYAEAGIDAKALGGHKTDRMAAQYQDSRGAEWVIVRAGNCPD